MILFVTHL